MKNAVSDANTEAGSTTARSVLIVALPSIRTDREPLMLCFASVCGQAGGGAAHGGRRLHTTGLEDYLGQDNTPGWLPPRSASRSAARDWFRFLFLLFNPALHA